RGALLDNLRTEIELLWLTGELRLEKPTVEQELAWGLYFINENLFEVVPELVEKLERALRQAYPGEQFDVPPFFQFGSWIGGDRDGNPFVTNEVTRRTLLENRMASLRRYRQRVGDLLRALRQRCEPPRAAVAPRGRGVPLQHLPARRAGQCSATDRRPRRFVARAKRRRAARCGVGCMARLARERAGTPAEGRSRRAAAGS